MWRRVSVSGVAFESPTRTPRTPSHLYHATQSGSPPNLIDMTVPTAEIIRASFEVNGRKYDPPRVPIAVVCIDGCGDEYLSISLARGMMPRLAEMLKTGHRSLVRGALPSFTNVNNSAMVTGCPPRETGIGGNYIIDPETGEEVMTLSLIHI